MNTSFEWDDDKDIENKQKHGVDFETAQYAFLDPKRVIAKDVAHSKDEKRYYCFGIVRGGCFNSSFYLPQQKYTNNWRGVLEKRQKYICKKK
jgi:hypothetical protein